MKVIKKARILLRLGARNVARVGIYRALLKSGYYRYKLPISASIPGPFFFWQASLNNAMKPGAVDFSFWSRNAALVLDGNIPVFSSQWRHTGFPPNWHRSVLTNVELSDKGKHWTLLSDFDLPGGDIKGYWESSRFEGLMILVLAWIGRRDAQMQAAIETWLQNWCAQNPANSGVQWKCGQESGLRILQTILVANLLSRWGEAQPTPSLCDMVAQHCKRIAPTMLYAIAQQNNHGTSEAAALFIGGAFLLRHGSASQAKQAERWSKDGRSWLEDRMEHLVLKDGAFSQHSINYHRLMLDTYSLVETLRRQWKLGEFSQALYERCRDATRWLAGMVDHQTGDAPNLGANDGARMFVLHQCGYRDYRPSVQWASVLFFGYRQYPFGDGDELLQWLDLEGAEHRAQDISCKSQLWPDGGYAKLANADEWLLLRLPRFRFRPSQSDALHLDLWVNGRNVLRDGGSYSYNATDKWLRYFSGVESHNTVQFDHRDQMPRISRFLFADWLQCLDLQFSSADANTSAAYIDSWGARHKRSVSLIGGSCEVIDHVSGFSKSAVLRWRLEAFGHEWQRVDGVWTSGRVRISINSSVPLCRQELIEGWESRIYGEKTTLPVLEVEVSSTARIVSTITW